MEAPRPQGEVVFYFHLLLDHQSDQYHSYSTSRPQQNERKMKTTRYGIYLLSFDLFLYLYAIRLSFFFSTQRRRAVFVGYRHAQLPIQMLLESEEKHNQL